jgi:hypothetical protein
MPMTTKPHKIYISAGASWLSSDHSMPSKIQSVSFVMMLLSGSVVLMGGDCSRKNNPPDFLPHSFLPHGFRRNYVPAASMLPGVAPGLH